MEKAVIPDDNQAYRFPVSVKGVILHQSQVALLKNRRNEWELPGGKLELSETPEACLVREVQEELGIPVWAGPLLDAWVYHIDEGVDVLIVTYGCYLESLSQIIHSPEHKAVGLFHLDQVSGLNMPEGYKKSIRSWSTLSGFQ